MVEFVRILLEKQDAGLVFGLGIVHNTIPTELIDHCERSALPLVSVDHHIPFFALNDVPNRLRQAQESHRQLLESVVIAELLALVQAGGSIRHLISPVLREVTDARGDLLHTLRRFMDSGRHIHAAIKKLSMHVNTVRHRLNRIHDIRGTTRTHERLSRLQSSALGLRAGTLGGT